MKYAKNASKLHIAFGDCLIEAGYGGFNIEQEVAVKKLCPNHSNGRDRFDYYIRELNVVVELHGRQHFNPATFGGISQNKAENNFVARVRKDEEKFLSAVKSGLYYISFRYDEPVTIELFHSKLEEARLLTDKEEEKKLIEKKKVDPWKEKIKEQNRQRRKEIYQQSKERTRLWREKMRKENEGS